MAQAAQGARRARDSSGCRPARRGMRRGQLGMWARAVGRGSGRRRGADGAALDVSLHTAGRDAGDLVRRVFDESKPVEKALICIDFAAKTAEKSSICIDRPLQTYAYRHFSCNLSRTRAYRYFSRSFPEPVQIGAFRTAFPSLCRSTFSQRLPTPRGRRRRRAPGDPDRRGPCAPDSPPCRQRSRSYRRAGPSRPRRWGSASSCRWASSRRAHSP